MHSTQPRAPQAAVVLPSGGSAAFAMPTTRHAAARTLAAMATTWYVVAALGQLLFVAYVVGFYGGHALRGDTAAWNQVLTHGIVAGDTAGNFVVVVHLAFAALLTVSGLLQPVPFVRRVAPTLHRWNGRFYVIAVSLVAVAGLVMVWTRGAAGALSQDIAININAFLILIFAWLAVREARARRFDAHRRWALRQFLVVSGVWFFRLMLPLWIVVNQGPVGFDPQTFQGPAITTISFADYLLPLAMLELYFHAQRAGARMKVAMAVGLGALTLLTAAGIACAAMILWLPKL